jgi:prolyl-tRNA synthetase
MMRAGMIKKLGTGIYTYMPMGLRVIRKVEAIVREEMNRSGAVELTMPVVQPAEFWEESGRFQGYGAELLRIKDRHERSFVIQPTSEEVVTDIIRKRSAATSNCRRISSDPDQVPGHFIRASADARARVHHEGCLRFDRDLDAAKASYQVMADAYRRIFDRFGLLPPWSRTAAPSAATSARVPGHCRDGRGRDRLLPGQRLRRQHGKGRGAGPRRPAVPLPSR